MRPAEWAEYEHRLGIIDLGTNSVRFDVYAINEKNQPERLHREKRMVRLGEGLFKNGKLDAKAEGRVNAALHDFSRMLHAWGVDSLTAYATSAMREAKPADRSNLIRDIKARHGIRLNVISGLREAQLTARGILEQESLPKGHFALVDIGGGSTELSVCMGKHVQSIKSFRLGTLRLQQLFLTHQPPKTLDLLAFRACLEETLPQSLPHCESVIGSSGTIRSLARMAIHAKHPFSPAFVRDLNLRMARMDRKGLLKLPGMEEKRVDLILAGSLLFEEIITRLGAKQLSATNFSLRDGVLSEMLEKLKKR